MEILINFEILHNEKAKILDSFHSNPFISAKHNITSYI